MEQIDQGIKIRDGKGKDLSQGVPPKQPFTEAQKAIFPLIASDIEAGTRAYALGQWEVAINHFGQLSELTEQAFGSDSPRYADALVLYGRALLQNAITQSELMTQKKLEETQKNTTHEEEENNIKIPKNSNIHFAGEPDFDQNGIYDDTEQPSKSTQLEGASSSGILKAGPSYDPTRGNCVKSASPTGARPNDQGTNDNRDADIEGKSEREGEDESENENEEACDFQTAWQVLDVARIIQAKDTTSKGQLKLAETLIFLGDVSMESENFDQACQDYSESLDIKVAQLSQSDKQVAEIRFKLALAFEYGGKKQEAVNQIELVEENLKLQISNCDKSKEEECKALNELLADVEEKVLELKASIQAPFSGVSEALSAENNPEISEKAKLVISDALLSGKINDLSMNVRSKKARADQEGKSVHTSNGSVEPNASSVEWPESTAAVGDIGTSKRKTTEGSTVENLSSEQKASNAQQTDKKTRIE